MALPIKQDLYRVIWNELKGGDTISLGQLHEEAKKRWGYIEGLLPFNAGKFFTDLVSHGLAYKRVREKQPAVYQKVPGKRRGERQIPLTAPTLIPPYDPKSFAFLGGDRQQDKKDEPKKTVTTTEIGEQILRIINNLCLDIDQLREEKNEINRKRGAIYRIACEREDEIKSLKIKIQDLEETIIELQNKEKSSSVDIDELITKTTPYHQPEKPI